jgi:hypothetical protein
MSGSDERHHDLPRFLSACVDEGILDVESARAVDRYRRTTGMGVTRSLGELGLAGSVPRLPEGPAGPDGGYAPILLGTPPDPEHTFATFVPSRANAFTIEVCRKVARQGGSHGTYNPLYIYSDVGLGKTHLVSAIVNAAGDDSAVLVNMADLEAEFERARRCDARAELRHWLLSRHVLCLDDIQFCERREDLQQEVFAVLNHCMRAGNTAVITSDVPPTRLAGIESRLTSRLGCGVIVSLQMCQRTERLEILRRLTAPGEIPDDVLEYLAENVRDNIRHLKASVRQLLAITEGSDVELTVDIARAVVPLPEDLRHPSSVPPADPVPGLPAGGATAPPEVRLSLFKEMLEGAENPEEQALALQIALGERIRQLRIKNGDPQLVERLERALELLRDGHAEEAIKCLDV